MPDNQSTHNSKMLTLLLPRRGFSKAKMLSILLLYSLVATALAQTKPDGDLVISAAERSAVIDGVITQLNKNYVFPEVSKAMEQAIRARQAKKEYDDISSGQDFARLLTEHLREVSKDKHLGVNFSPSPSKPDAEPSAADVERFRQSGARRNFEYRKVEHLDGGIGLLEVNGFYPGEMAADTVAAAMSFLGNSSAVIIDLRRNTGGAPTGVLLLESYFFDEETHVTDYYDRAAGTMRQSWTMPVVPGRSLADKDVYILTSSRTFSAPEDMAYNMQALKRATIVGETTGGGAHGTRPFAVTDRFSAGIPHTSSVNPVTKTDWEGKGVVPDVPVPADQALLTAHILALRKSLARQVNDDKQTEMLNRVLASKMKELKEVETKSPKP